MAEAILGALHDSDHCQQEMMARSSVLMRSSEFAAAACIASLGLSFAFSAPADGASPSVVLTPSGSFHDGQVISVSVGPNSLFTAHSGIHILECADPGGTQANLPKDISTCDGNTIQADSVLVNADGSFSEGHYTLYQLPSSTLGEQSNFQPVCDATNPCVLYVGQDQNDFTAPKIFSDPFSIGPNPSSVTTTTSASTTATTGAGGTSSGDHSGSLAQTGAPVGIWWTLTAGLLLLLGGAAARRIITRAKQ